MIIVHVLFDENQDYLGFKVSGHAGYGTYGKDIVCAAVSAVTLSTINATLELTDADVVYEAKSGLLRFKYARKPGSEERLLFSSMLLTLKSIEEQYGRRHLRIRYVQKLQNNKYILMKNQEV